MMKGDKIGRTAYEIDSSLIQCKSSINSLISLFLKTVPDILAAISNI